ncbi:MAG: MetQ/NlpA family ABC transporter substrate-binding protein [Acholeplasma sp.]|jgi:D-methionine transport system substrate-binding protein|nr:MetQ/NlpA family ABC transporter substrate-binding protein [Acholeplasma sp.]
MKKIITLLVVLFASFTLAACNNNEKTIKVIATSIPHAEILEFARPLLKERGYNLEVIITSDYYFPNPAVAAGDADANFFQHVPFLTKYNNENPDKNLVIASYVHIEPIGLYANTITSLSNIPDGATILLSNSTSDHGRALNLLAQAGLIGLSENFDILAASINFSEVIVSNPKNLVIRANVAPDFLISAYNAKEADLYIINSNYALEGNLNPLEDSIFIESTGNNPYVNVLAVRPGLLESEKIQALAEILNSQAVKDFITETYGGSVIPA